MKKAFAPFILIGTTLAASITGCQSKNEQAPVTIDSLVVNRRINLVENDSLSPSCQLNINLKFLAASDSVSTAINEQIIKLAFEMSNLTPSEAVDSFTQNYLNRYRNDLAEYYLKEQEKAPDAAWYNYTFDLGSQANNSQPDILNYQFTLDVYEGGAHGSHTLNYLNFDKHQAHLITLGDVFAEGYETKLTEHLLHALQKKLQAKTLDEVREQGYLTMNDMYPTPNFLLTADSIRFYYNAYEIAPYSAGPTELNFALSELADILKPQP